MGKRLDRAFEVMRERNRRYLEEQNKNTPPDTPDDPPLTEEQLEELRQAEEKAKRFHAQDGGTFDPGREEELREAEKKAKKFRELNGTELEKGDIPAMILSAMIVFAPIFIILGLLVVLAWFLIH